MKKLIKIRCKNCGDYFLKFNQKNDSGHGIRATIRPHHAVTCSRECSRQYNSIVRKISSLKRKELKKI